MIHNEISFLTPDKQNRMTLIPLNQIFFSHVLLFAFSEFSSASTTRQIRDFIFQTVWSHVIACFFTSLNVRDGQSYYFPGFDR